MERHTTQGSWLDEHDYTERHTRREHCSTMNIPLISQATEVFIDGLLAKQRPTTIREIGTAAGYSTLCMAQYMHHYCPTGRIISHEISYPHYWQSIDHLHKTHYDHYVYIYLGDFLRYTQKPLWGKAIDMVFIDGRKSDYLSYVQAIIPYIHSSTSIILDDVIKFKEKMTSLYDWLDKNKIPYTLYPLDSDDGIMTIDAIALMNHN